MTVFPPRLTPKDWIGIKIFLGIGATFLLALVAGVWLWSSRSVTSPKTLCLKKEPYHTHHVLLIDTTDQLSTFQTDLLTKIVSNLVRNALVFDRFTVFTVDSQVGGLSRPQFDMCKPDDGENMNPIYENPLMARDKFVRLFEEPLNALIVSLGLQESQDSSPIAESVSDLDKLRAYDSLAESVSLYVFSDLLQNGRKVSVYRSEKLPTKRSCSGERKEGEVFIYALERPEFEKLQSDQLMIDWANFFASCMIPGKEIYIEHVRH